MIEFDSVCEVQDLTEFCECSRVIEVVSCGEPPPERCQLAAMPVERRRGRFASRTPEREESITNGCGHAAFGRAQTPAKEGHGVSADVCRRTLEKPRDERGVECELAAPVPGHWVLAKVLAGLGLPRRAAGLRSGCTASTACS